MHGSRSLLRVLAILQPELFTYTTPSTFDGMTMTNPVFTLQHFFLIALGD